jgi:hypothetical protein
MEAGREVADGGCGVGIKTSGPEKPHLGEMKGNEIL